MNLNELFALNVRKIRISKHLSQEKLAELSNVHRTYISLVERGKRNVTLANLEKIAKGLDVEPFILLQR